MYNRAFLRLKLFDVASLRAVDWPSLSVARTVGGTVYVWQDGCSRYWKGTVGSNAPTKYGKKQWYVEYENDTQLHVEKEEEMIL